jgi:peroxiredoxin family protein
VKQGVRQQTSVGVMKMANQISFSSWYANKFGELNIFVQLVMWLFYGFIWIPILYMRQAQSPEDIEKQEKIKMEREEQERTKRIQQAEQERAKKEQQEQIEALKKGAVAVYGCDYERGLLSYPDRINDLVLIAREDKIIVTDNQFKGRFHMDIPFQRMADIQPAAMEMGTIGRILTDTKDNEKLEHTSFNLVFDNGSDSFDFSKT